MFRKLWVVLSCCLASILVFVFLPVLSIKPSAASALPISSAPPPRALVPD